jgi:hypothetical protein
MGRGLGSANPSPRNSRLDREAGLKDWELKKIIVDDDWTFVTNNSADFRGPSEEPRTAGQYAVRRSKSISSHPHSTSWDQTATLYWITDYWV